jgi:hypothetical protein
MINQEGKRREKSSKGKEEEEKVQEQEAGGTLPSTRVQEQGCGVRRGQLP